MRRGLELVAFAVAALLLQGAASAWLPPPWLPDFGLLLTVLAGLVLGPIAGSLVAVTVGLAADLLSEALMGQHALLRLLALWITRAANHQLELRRAGPLAVFVFAVTLASGAGLFGLARLFEARVVWSVDLLATLAIHAAVNAAVATPFAALAGRVLALPGVGSRGPRVRRSAA